MCTEVIHSGPCPCLLLFLVLLIKLLSFFRVCIYLFSRFATKPRKGVQFLQEKKLVAMTPDAVAQILYTDDRFSKSAVGDYLGEGNE